MGSKVTAGVLVTFFVLAASAYAQERQLSVNDVAVRMQKEVNLTDEQADAVKPIIKESMLKRRVFFDSMEGQASFNQANVRIAMRKFKEQENQQLSKVLSEEQMKKLIAKQNLMESLNKDQIDYSETLGTGMASGPGAMQF